MAISEITNSAPKIQEVLAFDQREWINMLKDPSSQVPFLNLSLSILTNSDITQRERFNLLRNSFNAFRSMGTKDIAPISSRRLTFEENHLTLSTRKSASKENVPVTAAFWGAFIALALNQEDKHAGLHVLQQGLSKTSDKEREYFMTFMKEDNAVRQWVKANGLEKHGKFNWDRDITQAFILFFIDPTLEHHNLATLKGFFDFLTSEKISLESFIEIFHYINTGISPEMFSKNADLVLQIGGILSSLKTRIGQLPKDDPITNDLADEMNGIQAKLPIFQRR